MPKEKALPKNKRKTVSSEQAIQPASKKKTVAKAVKEKVARFFGRAKAKLASKILKPKIKINLRNNHDQSKKVNPVVEVESKYTTTTQKQLSKKGCVLHSGKKRLKFYHHDGRKKLIRIAISDHPKKPWKNLERTLETRKGYFDEKPMHILGTILVEEGIVFFYFTKSPCLVGAALFDKDDPEKLLWRSANPIFTAGKGAAPLKLEFSEREAILYFVKNKKVQKIKILLDVLLRKLKLNCPLTLRPIAPVIERSSENPILEPKLTHQWESFATFNAAAVYLEGKVHFIYRAIGQTGMSVLGYAASEDGVHISERLSEPVYIPKEPFEFRKDKNIPVAVHYASGGGWGGCEDPRLTKIGDTLYMTYTAFNGSQPPGVALTSISVADFLNKKWNWHTPILISPRGAIHKNWVLFPEKIHNKYAVLHSISPRVQIDYLDDISLDREICIHSHYSAAERNGCWDNQLRGVGPSPINTPDGWLIFYHAMDRSDPNKYKLGAMLLDHQDPTRVLYRAVRPVLEPDAYYELHGYKSGVIYACGAVVINDRLFVYYGGADTVTCVATASFSEFLKRLKSCHVLHHGPSVIAVD
ncbi:MAG: hypothetical protein KKA99_00915 [Gammaproteobacteria bacterium]|nr:hypothetical protein [Gammaproteobacteria bacterium]MBU1559094.1 hypothetical protein [Gammaproteobacteria bacterium]MBU2546582.1 hypothetical protein [Gammaproteobacteria bacterium]